MGTAILYKSARNSCVVKVICEDLRKSCVILEQSRYIFAVASFHPVLKCGNVMMHAKQEEIGCKIDSIHFYGAGIGSNELIYAIDTI